ncbi:MAG: NAD(P)H-dependent oxidoreductase subunit E [Sphingobacteriales bacterium]|nr:MAG: NAD(P)H-dependent oxidoreductase subunit E [Sphingobacteriales bacterium]
MSIQFSDARMARFREIIARYPEDKKKSALIPVLHLAQEEWHWLDVPTMDYVASLLGLSPIEVYEVASFYTMFHLKPIGKYVLEICHTGPCMLRGSDQLMDHVKNRLGIEAGQTTADGMFTLKPAECLGACGYAPMMQLGKFYQENLTPEKMDRILDELRAGTLQTA